MILHVIIVQNIQNRCFAVVNSIPEIQISLRKPGNSGVPSDPGQEHLSALFYKHVHRGAPYLLKKGIKKPLHRGTQWCGGLFSTSNLEGYKCAKRQFIGNLQRHLTSTRTPTPCAASADRRERKHFPAEGRVT